MYLTPKLIERIQKYDTKGSNNEFSLSIFNKVSSAIKLNQPINLISFTCSMIDSEYLFSKKPWLYINTSPVGNNLEPDIKSLFKIAQDLQTVYPKIQLKILIGNTDPYYIYLQQFKSFPEQVKKQLWNKFDNRWEVYRQNFTNWIKELKPKFNLQVLSWYQFEKEIEQTFFKSFETEYEQTKNNIYQYFTAKQLGWELQQLKTQFGPGKYFANLKKPTDDLLRDWVVRKFTEYAVQAKWIYDNIPNAILIQNEKPSDLRSQMYQPLIQETYKDVLPVVYFFGVDNKNYQ